MERRNAAPRRRTPIFKCNAVDTMRARLAAGVTLQRISEELDVTAHLVRAWEKPSPAHRRGRGQRRFSQEKATRVSFATLPRPRAPSESPGAELRRLRRENERLRMERG